jgi:hypothetical protein
MSKNNFSLAALRQKIIALIEKDPKKAAKILTEWTRRPAAKRVMKKTG